MIGLRARLANTVHARMDAYPYTHTTITDAVMNVVEAELERARLEAFAEAAAILDHDLAVLQRQPQPPAEDVAEGWRRAAQHMRWYSRDEE
ncbi:hypothetical protein [Nocardiopsis sp. LOL_012]|uniref:hypothetical protein n=1 Tax=Nocardiopsis sp. LOL_012 TaxID=3345409 RepID=UPI003A84AB41